jgi:hypothetical protein
MNPFGLFSGKQVPQSAGTLASFVNSSEELCGAVFVLIEGDNDEVTRALSLIHGAADLRGIWFLGMVSRVFQFMLKEVSEESIEVRTRAFAEEVARLAGKHASVVWTVQRTTWGCWGTELSTTYGALVPNVREILRLLGNCTAGQVLKV